ncbi:MAG: calcium/sodium antiporter [Alphaproteobacteria bacterium]|jgi:cation:H+ antiporter|tara:strand:- start:1408 stop:2349 length:942 start_codon:yes stop_codon:yes gene_type:complete
MIMMWLYIILGLLILVSSADFLVRGAVNLSNIFKISPYIIAGTLVAFGTSAPELFVSGIASYSGNPGAAIGNILGSNIANVFLALGIAAIIINISPPKNAFQIDIKILAASSIILIILLFNISLVYWWVGLILILSLFIYIFYIIKFSDVNNVEENNKQNLSLSKALILFFIGLIGVSLGAKLLTEGSIDLARYFGIRETIVGLGVLAFGTSLPEVVTSIIAAIKKENNIAIGNIVGSNIFNILGIGGVTILISGNEALKANPNLLTISDTLPFILSSIILVAFYKYRLVLNRLYGVLFVTSYLVWISFIFIK